jgi:NAD(P)-dependent dehydrogenase (short-subunit alcohol dehydrogenase family)
MNDRTNRQFSRRRFLQLSAAATLIVMNRASSANDGGPQAPGAVVAGKGVGVLGASGTVGNAVTRELLASGHRVVTVSRSAEKLEKIRAAYARTHRIEVLQGDVSSDELAGKLRDSILEHFGKLDGVVSSLGGPEADAPMRVLDASTATLKKAFDTNFFTHVTAARALIPALNPRGVYVGINGGLADLVVPDRGALSMTQSALRSLYRVLAQEAQLPDKVAVRLLELYGLVATDQNRSRQTGDMWIPDEQVGKQVTAIITDPGSFAGPILSLKSKRFS